MNKIKFCAALLTTALSISLLAGCSAGAIAPDPREIPTVTQAHPIQEAIPATDPANRITKEEAIAIALAEAGFREDQVTRLRAEFDYDDGIPEYEVEFHRYGFEYDYEIHGETGAIRSREKDRIH